MKKSINKYHILVAIAICFIWPGQAFSTTVEKGKSERDNPVISGQININPGSIPFAGAVVTFWGIGDVLADEDGYYEMEVPQGWNGNAVPHDCGGNFYDFSPQSYTYNNVIENITDQNFTAETDTVFVISGTITDKVTGEPLANKQITFYKEFGLPPWSFMLETNEFGEYSFEQLPCWSNVVNPGIMGGFYYLEPFTREYENLSSDMSGEDYTFINFEYPTPPGWDYSQTGDVHIISIEKTSFPNLCGTPFELGDLIGAFYYNENQELKCGGFARWHDENNVALIVQGDDNLTVGIKEGFGYFEEMNWRVYSYERAEEFPAITSYRSGGFLVSNNKFVPGGLSIIEEVDASFANLITIPQGWSGFSSYTNPNVQPLISKIVEPILDKLILIQDMEKMYYPAAGINNLLLWHYNKGYKIKVSEEAYLPMSGCQESNTSVNLSPTWNILPVLSKCEVDPVEFFSPVIDKLIIVKQIAGNGVYWPELGINNLGPLVPGKAYYVAVSANATLTYDDCDAMKSIAGTALPKENSSNPPMWNLPESTGNDHTIAFKTDALSGLESGDYIGCFDEGGNCFGLTMLHGPSSNQSIILFGDDPSSSEKEGFFPGEEIHFKIFNATHQQAFDAHAFYDAAYPNYNGEYVDNGLSVIDDLKWSSTGIHNLADYFHFYPNPSSGKVTFVNSNNSSYVLRLFTMDGRELLSHQASGSIDYDFSDYKQGVYILKISDGTSTITEKLILK